MDLSQIRHNVVKSVPTGMVGDQGQGPGKVYSYEYKTEFGSLQIIDLWKADLS